MKYFGYIHTLEYYSAINTNQYLTYVTTWVNDAQKIYIWASLVASLILVKNLPAMQETWVQSLGWEDPLEKGKATHSSIMSWKIPWTESPWGHKELDTAE